MQTQKNKIFTGIVLVKCILGILFISTKLSAQNYMMSSVGFISGTSSNASYVQFTSNANCVNVQSGLAVFNAIRNTGEFSINCAVTQDFNKLGIKLYPNPATTSTRVKFMSTPPLNEEFSVSVLTTGGIMLSNRKETGATLFQGIMLDVSSLVSGSYIIKIESVQYVDAIKFIKAN
jgi:hypothetical protein